MDDRTFKAGPVWMVLGGMFVIGAGFFALAPIYYALSGKPMMVGRESGPVHPARAGEMIGISSFAMIGVLAGAGIILYGKNWSITLTVEGVCATNFIGKVAFSADWAELTMLKSYAQDGSRAYKLQSIAGQVWIPSNTRDLPELLEQLRERAPQLQSSETRS